MEQRRDPRFETDQPVTLTILADGERVIPARVRNVSGRGLGLEVDSPVQPGAAVKIETEDAIILAEAVFCRRDQDTYFVGMALEQVLSGLAELGRILQQYQDESSTERHSQWVEKRS